MGEEKSHLKKSVTFSKVGVNGRRETPRNFLWNAAQRERGKIIKAPARDIKMRVHTRNQGQFWRQLELNLSCTSFFLLHSPLTLLST